MRVGILWSGKDLGIYCNSSLYRLQRGFGQNTGNLVYLYAIEKQISGNVTLFPADTDPKYLREVVDIIILPCSNQLGSHSDLGRSAEILRAANLPVVAIGLGAQAQNIDEDIILTEGTMKWLKIVSELAIGDAPNIYVRGIYTQRQLERLGFSCSIPGGCPSFFINESPNLGAKIAANWKEVPKRIAVAAGNYSLKKEKHLEHQLASLISDRFYPGTYITQSPKEMILMARGKFDNIELAKLRQINDYIAPHLEMSEFQSWCATYAKTFYDIPSWMDHLSQHNIVIGPRYHGVALALQAERMGLTITIDTRTAELCHETGIPHIPYSEIKEPLTRQIIFDKLIKFNARQYDQLRREQVSKYISFLISNKLNPSEYLHKLS